MSTIGKYGSLDHYHFLPFPPERQFKFEPMMKRSISLPRVVYEEEGERGNVSLPPLNHPFRFYMRPLHELGTRVTFHSDTFHKLYANK